jgi:hypothetical protein
MRESDWSSDVCSSDLKIHDARTVCDIAFSDASGQMVAELIGVETVLRPGETKTAPALA